MKLLVLSILVLLSVSESKRCRPVDENAPPATVCTAEFRDYNLDDAPVIDGFYAGTYDDGTDIYLGTFYLAAWDENQPVPIELGVGGKFIDDNNKVQLSTVTKYLVPDPNCRCHWKKSSNGTWEDGAVSILQPGYGDPWTHFIGAIFNKDKSLNCTGPVSNDWHKMTCGDKNGFIFESTTYKVLVCHTDE